MPQAAQKLIPSLRRHDLRRSYGELVAAVMAELCLLSNRNTTRGTDSLILIQSNFDVAQAIVQRTSPRRKLIVADLVSIETADFDRHPT